MVDLDKTPQYLKELESPNLPCPALLDLGALVPYEDTQLGELRTHTGDAFKIYSFIPEDETLPLAIAQWLHFLTHVDDSIATYHEADRYRFDDIEDIRTKFLTDQGGRHLLVAVDQQQRTLAGVCWTHVLQNDEKDFTLVRACLEKTGTQFPKLRQDESVSSEFVTIANRAYLIYRHRIGVALAVRATHYALTSDEDQVGVVGRFSLHDPFILDTSHESNLTDDLGVEFRPIDGSSESGYEVLLAVRDEYREPDTWTRYMTMQAMKRYGCVHGF